MLNKIKIINEFVIVGVESFDTRVRYIVKEPPLSDEELETVNITKSEMMYMEDKIPISVLKNCVERSKLIGETARRILLKRVKDQSIIDKLVYYIVRDLAGYGKIDALMRDEDIEDISCSGANLPIYIYHKRFGYVPTNIVFEAEELTRFIYRLSAMIKRQISISQPLVEGMLPDGSRVNCCLPIVSTKGGTFTIRKYTFKPLSILELIKYGTLDIDIATYLWLLMDHKKSILISGEVGSGKTTLMNAILGMIFRDEKIITIEETPEIRLDGFKNWSQKVTRESYRLGVKSIDLFELVKSALRERPDYIIVGEVRGREAYTLFQAIALGHGGIATIHAGSIEKAIKRLASEPMNIPESQIPLISTIIHMIKIPGSDGIKRRIGRISEIVEGEKGLKLNDIYRYDYDKDVFIKLNDSAVLEELESKGINPAEEFGRRRLILEYASRRFQRSWSDLVRIIAQYNLSKKETYEKALLHMSEG